MSDPTFTTAPTAPSRRAPTTFSALMDAFLAYIVTLQAELSAAVPWFRARTDEVVASAATAEAARDVAVAAAGATAWVSGASYSAGDVVYSLIDFQTYRASSAVTSTTDPSADAANWEQISADPADFLSITANLSDLNDAATARSNLGLGTMALETASNYLTIASASATYLTQANAESTYLSLSGGTVTGPLKIAELQETETFVSGATPTINLEAGTVFRHTLNANTTYTFSNPVGSGDASSFTLIVNNASGSFTQTWPASVEWPEGSAPDATASGETDLFVFVTTDGGTTWYGCQAGNAMA